mgnify:CR=1 FL=1
MKLFAGLSAIAVVAVSAAGVASALNANQPNNAPATNQAQQPVYRCESLGIDHIASDSYKFSVKYAAYNGATYKGTVYRVYDANGKEVYNTAGAKFNGFEPGNYTAKAFVTVSVNGKDETVTSDGCTKTFTIKAAQNDQNNKPDKPSEPTPQPQEPSNPNQNKPDDQKPTPQQPSKPDNQNKPNNPAPQQPSTPAKPTEPSKPTTPSQPGTKPTTPNTPNTPSKPAAPANPAPTNQQSSPTATADSNATTTQTNTANSPSNNASAPNQLPKTGISELAGLAGTGSLGYALYAYIVSRKNR